MTAWEICSETPSAFFKYIFQGKASEVSPLGLRWHSVWGYLISYGCPSWQIESYWPFEWLTCLSSLPFTDFVHIYPFQPQKKTYLSSYRISPLIAPSQSLTFWPSQSFKKEINKYRDIETRSPSLWPRLGATSFQLLHLPSKLKVLIVIPEL